MIKRREVALVWNSLKVDGVVKGIGETGLDVSREAQFSTKQEVREETPIGRSK